MCSQALVFYHKQAQQANPCITQIIADYVTSPGISDLQLQKVQTSCFVSNQGSVKQPTCNVSYLSEDFRQGGSRLFFYPLAVTVQNGMV